MLKDGLTIHAVVRNEPFIYYSIKSIYEYADVIFLYDTGSYDKHTLNDIQKLLDEDIDKKIIFKEVEIDTDETKWSVKNLKQMINDNKKVMRTVGWVRKMQIRDTETNFFMILDGDEIHYKRSMGLIKKFIIPNWDDRYICGYIPLTWYSSINTTHKAYGVTGRIFKTEYIWLNDDSPNEIHIDKNSNKILSLDNPVVTTFKNLVPFAHFELMLKPWRRPDVKEHQMIKKLLPEVMEEDKYYIDRFLKSEEK